MVGWKLCKYGPGIRNSQKMKNKIKIFKLGMEKNEQFSKTEKQMAKSTFVCLFFNAQHP